MDMEQVSEKVLRIVEEIAKRTTTEHYRLVLNEEREAKITGSKVGGMPYWPANKDFPVDAEGNKMLLLMQINCEEAGLKAPVKREAAIDKVAEPTSMGVNDGHFNRLFADIVKDITGDDMGDKAWYAYLNNDECLLLEQQGMKRPHHQMLGYPVYTQDEARRDIEYHDTLLFQLDSQFSTQGQGELVMWGDMGSGFIFIHHDDLAALDFTHTYYCWDCG